jgi:hypothetical protein
MAVAALPVDRDLCDRFARDGFVHVAAADVLAGIDAGRIVEQLTPAFAGVDRVMDAWTTCAGVRAIATHPEILATLRMLYGREPIPFQTLTYRTGSGQRTHSDTIHFSSLPGGWMCGVWVALEDVGPDQGPLHYYPGSHRLPAVDYEDLGIDVPPPPFTWNNPATAAAYGRYEDAVEDLLRAGGFARTELTIARGAYAVWAANLFHGGAPIREPARTRWSVVTHYFFADTVPYTPMFSRRSRGAYAVRAVRDIRTGTYTVPSLDGVPVLFERAGGGLHRIRRVGAPHERLTWQIMKHRPLPETPLSIVRDRLRRFTSRGIA